MKAKTVIATLALILAAGALAPGAMAAHPAAGNFGVEEFDVTFTEADGTTATQAGSHPFAMDTSLLANRDSEDEPEGWLRDLFFELPRGLLADTTAYERCSTVDFLENEGAINKCSLNTQVGIAGVSLASPGHWDSTPVFNLVPPPGVLLRLGFSVESLDVVIDAGLDPEEPHNPTAASRNTLQLLFVFGSKVQLWGDPSSSGHDELRGLCGIRSVNLPSPSPAAFEFQGEGSCSVASNSKPLLTLPTNCSEPLASTVEAFSWEGESDFEEVLTHDAGGNPQPFAGCEELAFHPSISARPTSLAAESPTGLDFSIAIKDDGLTKNVEGRAQSQIKKTVVTLPEGMTANPSLAEGLEVCSEADLAGETLAAAPGEGCPQASKIGTLEVESPLVSKVVKGALFQAAPNANLAGDSLIAFYIVFKDPELGLLFKIPVKVEPDPRTGQLVATTARDLPQVAFSSFRLHFREGGRSPLVSPPTCGEHRVQAELTPWSGTPPVTEGSTFEVLSGPGGGPCPPGGAQPFEPGFDAGSVNNAAAAYSPFFMRLTRRDGDQDLTRFDATLPKGVLARLAGVDRCPEAQIALARSKSGKAELASPSCPLNSRIGGVEAGAGVGSQLTYVSGQVYLAGPFAGAPLSAVAVVPAVAGPFDVGTVVYRQALSVDPRSGVVSADGAASDPLPHILAGIPLRVRDVQVHIDRSAFTLNPTDCDPLATEATIWGGGADPFSRLDDGPLARQARYQASGCARLGFVPRLALRLRGGTRRGAHPALRAVLRPRPGQANIERAVVRLPRSAFLEQGHIRTVCTRVQFAADACPKGAVYGHVTAYTPLLSEPLKGPVYLRSSNNKLPDLVFDLHGIVDFEAVARIDSIRGGIRTIFTGVPDAPISRVVLNMQGARKGLIVNSTDLCAKKHRANARFGAHSAKQRTLKPLLRPSCKQKRRAKRARHSRRG